MITHKIAKNKPYVPYVYTPPNNLQHHVYCQCPTCKEKNSLAGNVARRMQQHPNFNRTLAAANEVVDNGKESNIPEEDRVKLAHFADKHNYNWFIGTLYATWPKGKTVTLKMFAEIQGQAPPLFVVTDFQEMRHMAEWCPVMKEPRAVFLKSIEGISQWIAPKAIRELTAQELQVANLHNPKAEESGTPAQGATNPDDPSVGAEHYAG